MERIVQKLPGETDTTVVGYTGVFGYNDARLLGIFETHKDGLSIALDKELGLNHARGRVKELPDGKVVEFRAQGDALLGDFDAVVAFERAQTGVFDWLKMHKMQDAELMSAELELLVGGRRRPELEELTDHAKDYLRILASAALMTPEEFKL